MIYAVFAAAFGLGVITGLTVSAALWVIIVCNQADKP
jgi:hypothetical protein